MCLQERSRYRTQLNSTDSRARLSGPSLQVQNPWHITPSLYPPPHRTLLRYKWVDMCKELIPVTSCLFHLCPYCQGKSVWIKRGLQHNFHTILFTLVVNLLQLKFKLVASSLAVWVQILTQLFTTHTMFVSFSSFTCKIGTIMSNSSLYVLKEISAIAYSPKP